MQKRPIIHVLLWWMLWAGSCLASPPPVITVQPLDQTVQIGDTATFTVAATSGTTLTYQWYCNGQAVSHATNATLSGTITTSSNAGNYRAAISNAGGTVNSSNATLTVICPPPTSSTLSVSNITISSAVLNAAVNPQGSTTAYCFQYGLSTNYGFFSLTNTVAADATNVIVGRPIAGLMDATLYHYRVVAVNSGGTSVGEDASFATSIGAPSGSNLSATSLTVNGATLNAQVTQQLLALTCCFQYGETTNYGNVSSMYLLPALTGILGGGGLLGVAIPVAGLTPGHIYHYRLVLSGLGTTYGQDASFMTTSLPPVQLNGRVRGSGLGVNGKMQLGFTSTPGASFTVLCSTNMLTWTAVGTMTEVSPGQYQFTDPMPATNPACWYRIRSP